MSTRTSAVAALLACVLVALACNRTSEEPALDTSVFGPAVRRQLDEALAASESSSEDADAQGRLGMALHAYRLLGPAVEAYARAAELDPSSFRWRYYHGRALAAAGRNDEALAVLSEALSMREDYAPGWVSVADLLLESGDAVAAAHHYRRAAELDPQSPRALYGLGKSLRAEGDAEAAERALSATLRLVPRFGAAHYSLGLLYRDLGDEERAAEELAEAARLGRGQAPGRDPLMAAVVALATGAADLTKEAIDLYQEGKADEAVAKLDAVVELDPEYVPARVNLIKIHGDRGRWELAEKHYRAAIAISPNAQQVRFNFARTLIQRGRLEEAEAELGRVVEINPHLADAQVLLGSLLEERGTPDQAVRRYELALASKPGHPQGNLMMVKHRLSQGRVSEADEFARRVLESDTRSLAILVYRLALFYEQAGLELQAREHLLRARELASSAGRSRLVAEIDERLKGES